MRLLQSIRLFTLFLVTVLTTFALAINDDPGSAGRPKPFSPSHGQAPGSAPSSVTVPLSPCVNKCLAEVAMKGSCSSFTDKLCFCANLILATDLQHCVLATCPSQETQAMTVYAETCGILPGSSPLSTLLSSFGLEPTAPGSALPTTAPLPASSIKATPGTQPAAPTSPGAPAPAPTASEPVADPHATTAAAPKASTPTPAAAAGNGGGASSANSAAPSSEATDSAGDEVTVTVTTDSPDGTALNPHVNGAGRRGFDDVFGAKAGLAVVGGVGILGWVF